MDSIDIELSRLYHEYNELRFNKDRDAAHKKYDEARKLIKEYIQLMYPQLNKDQVNIICEDAAVAGEDEYFEGIKDYAVSYAEFAVKIISYTERN